MHQATCSECGQSCEIPFRPTGDRPVFCSKCFDKQGGGGDRQRKIFSDRKDRSRSDDGQMHSAVCAKCGKTCQVPFRPTAGKPVYCDDCFKGEGGKNKGSGEILDQIKQLNVKIDKLIKTLSPETSVEKPKALIEKTEKPKKEKSDKIKKDTVIQEKKTKTVAKKKPTKKIAKK